MSGRFDEALSVEGLALVRGGRLVFEGLAFAAGPGAFVALTGPNGSGKTSLLRAMAGFLRPAAGAIRGASPERIHFVGHRDGLKPALSAAAHGRFWAGLLGGAEAAIEPALARVGLAGDLPARILSQGQQRRLALARLLIAPRPFWLLDEPAAALDSSGKALLGELIDAHRAAGGVVIAALHEHLAVTPTRTLALGVRA